MPSIPGTIVTDKISPGDTLNTFPTHEDIYGKGGLMSVASIADLQAIPLDRQKVGMLVFVQNENRYYAITATSAPLTTYVPYFGVTNSNLEVARLLLGTTSTALTGYGIVSDKNIRVNGVDLSSQVQILSVLDTDGQSLLDLRSANQSANYSLSLASSGANNFMKLFGGREGDQKPFILVKTGQPIRFASFSNFYNTNNDFREWVVINTNPVTNVTGTPTLAVSGAVTEGFGGRVNTNAHAEGFQTVAIGQHSHTQNWQTSATATAAHAEGWEATASGIASHAEGYQTKATQQYAHAEGLGTEAGNTCHAEGFNSKATGTYAHAEGSNTESYGNSSHAEGANTIANNAASHAEGMFTQAIADAAHAEGNLTMARGIASHAAGYRSEAAHDYSWVWSGNSTLTQRVSSTKTQQFVVSAANGIYFPGRVGIGTDSVANPLTVSGVVSATAYYGDGSNLTGLSPGGGAGIPTLQFTVVDPAPFEFQNTINGVESIVQWNDLTMLNPNTLSASTINRNIHLREPGVYRVEYRYASYDLRDATDFLRIRLYASSSGIISSAGSATLLTTIDQGYVGTTENGQAAKAGMYTFRILVPTWMVATFLHGGASGGPTLNTGYPVFENSQGTQSYLRIEKIAT